jgi:uncharacterized peroxidase-related enzyme
MAHIQIASELPGITGLLNSRPGSGKILRALAQHLLRKDSGMSHGERELLATSVSVRNRCEFCSRSHGSAAALLLAYPGDIVEDLRSGKCQASQDDRMQALLAIAAKVQGSASDVSEADISKARASGADDEAIHDTVLIAAAFCMYNRYVDGLATAKPPAAAYPAIGERLVKTGYIG